MAIRFYEQDVRVSVLKRVATRASLMRVVFRLGYENAEINYIFCSDEALLEINRKYLNHDTYTDIITFDYSRPDVSGMVFPDMGGGKTLCGDIYISYDRVRENAKMFHVKHGEELNRVLVHGVLHLAGYKDKKPEEEKKMREMENLMTEICFGSVIDRK